MTLENQNLGRFPSSCSSSPVCIVMLNECEKLAGEKARR
jgi:hypothetical protein